MGVLCLRGLGFLQGSVRPQGAEHVASPKQPSRDQSSGRHCRVLPALHPLYELLKPPQSATMHVPRGCLWKTGLLGSQALVSELLAHHGHTQAGVAFARVSDASSPRAGLRVFRTCARTHSRHAAPSGEAELCVKPLPLLCKE